MTCRGCAFSTRETVEGCCADSSGYVWTCWQNPGEPQERATSQDADWAPPACADRWEGK